MRRLQHLKNLKKGFDVVIVGGGHNGLVAAAYLQKNGFQACVVEKREVLGGAAVSEEIVPGFKFSRASYVLSLLRPAIYRDLKLKEFGLKVYQRDPSSYTPLLPQFWTENAKSLVLCSDSLKNRQELSKFSEKDANQFPIYEMNLYKIATCLDPFLDISPNKLLNFLDKSLTKKLLHVLTDKEIRGCVKSLIGLGSDEIMLQQLLTSSPSEILSEWFESDVLKATLTTDALIGTVESPFSPGSGYVLLLHSMLGHCDGQKGRWGYPEGGMGAVSEAIAKSAKSLGTEILTNTTVKEIVLDQNQRAVGVLTEDNDFIPAKMVFSNATSKVTFLDLLPENILDPAFVDNLRKIDYASGVTKINVALKRLPNFVANTDNRHLQATIHLNNESTDKLHTAWSDFQKGQESSRPIIEMTLPSVVDKTIAPPGCHVCHLFTQYTPKTFDKEAYAKKVFSQIDEYAPGFYDSVIGYEVLGPDDLESIFGLTGGNLFHGAMSPNKLFFLRPWGPKMARSLAPLTPIKGLLLCGSGIHPGGGVSGAPGRIAALEAVNLLNRNIF